MLKVGLTGGLASGKSYVAGILEKLGCHVIHADRLGHEALLPGGGAYEDVVAEFGEAVLTPDRRIDRRALGKIVFAGTERLQRLNSLVHPHVFRRQQELLEEIQQTDPHAIAVVEAAIMIEAGSYRRYDRLVLAACPEELQIRRYMEREGASEEEARARLARQMPLEEKKKYADYVVDTSGTKAETERRVRELYERLKTEAS